MEFSSSSPASEPYFSVEEIAEELAFQNALLISIQDNPDAEDRDSLEIATKTEIRILEEKLKLQRKVEAVKEKSQPVSNSRPSSLSGMPSRASNGFTTSRAGYAAESADPSLRYTTPDLLDHISPSDQFSPSYSNLPSRKRQHSDSRRHLQSGNKAQRTSLSPGMSCLAAPMVISEFEDDYMTSEQLNALERACMERSDEEVARKLQEEENQRANPRSPSKTAACSPGPKTYFDRMYGFRRGGPNSVVGGGTIPPKAELESRHSTQMVPGSWNASIVTSEPCDDSQGRDTDSDDSDLQEITQENFREGSRITNPSFLNPGSRMRDGVNWRASPAGISGFDPSKYSTDHLRNPSVNQSPSNWPGSPNSLYRAQSTSRALGPASSYSSHAQLNNSGRYMQHQPHIGVAGTSVYDPYGMQGTGPYSNSATTGLFNGLLGPKNALSNVINQASSHLTWLQNPSLSDQIDDYINDPRKTKQEIQELLENIRPDMEIPKENREGTPDGLKYPLYEHQKLALAWMKSNEEGSNKGGILADDMGLGKTISTLALILARPSSSSNRKTTLIIGPVSLVRQWQREIETKIVLAHRLSTFLYHNKKNTYEDLRTYDIVLTTYGTIAAEFTRLEKWEKDLKKNPRLLDRTPPNKRHFPFLGNQSMWYRVILDEAQCIKNRKTKAALGACQLKSLTRFCLTGTPMMNGVHELHSLIQFLRIRPYNDSRKFGEDFGCLSKGGRTDVSRKSAMKKMQVLLKAILLRRTKKSELDGQPILTLPEKRETIQHVVFDEDQLAYYKSIEMKTQLMFNKYVKEGTVGKNYSNILVLLLRLRQAACHPHLIMDFEEAPSDMSKEDMITLAKSLEPDVINRIKMIEAFECPVCYEPSANPRLVIPCGHNTCGECLVRVLENVIQGIAEGDESGSARCPTCRGKVESQKVIDYVTFKKVHMADASSSTTSGDDTESDGETVSVVDSDTDSEFDIDGEFKSPKGFADIEDFVVPDDAEDPIYEEEEEEDDHQKNVEDGAARDKDDDEINMQIKGGAASEESEHAVQDISNSTRSSQRKKNKRRKKKGKGKEKAKKVEVKHMSLSQLKRDASKTARGRASYMKYLKDNFVSSAKLDKTMELLAQIQKSGHKTIIFSQFTTLLDLLEIPILEREWGYTRYDGSMSAIARSNAVNEFTDKPGTTIMLISLKAGNAGLNLTAASRVIILDPFWNPYIEMQAVDRAHRIGQRNEVEVHRILVEQTVEDRIITLQNEKKQLVEAALDENASQRVSRLGLTQLRYLFNGNQ